MSYMNNKNILFAILVSFIFIIPLLTFPSILHFNENYIGEGVDNYQFAAFQQLAAKNIKEFGLPFTHSSVWRYPTGFDFTKSLDGVFHTISGAFFILSGFSPVTANNLSVYLALFINLLCGFALFRYIYASNLIAYFGSIVYGVSFYALARGVGHVNLMLIGGFPLFVYALLRLQKKQDILSLLILFVSLLLVIFSSLAYVAMLGGSLIVGFCLALLFYKKETIDYLVRLQPFFKALIVTIGFVGVIFIILFHSYIISLFNHTFTFALNASDYTPLLQDYFIPNQSRYLAAFKWLFVNTQFQIERSVFLGYVEIILFSLGIIKLIRKKYTLFLLAICITFFIFSLGTFNKDLNVYLPYWVLVKILPFSAVPETGRYYVVFYLFFTLIILSFLQSIRQRISKKNFILMMFILFVLVLVERLPSRYFLSNNLEGEFIKHVRSTRTNAVLDIPLYDRKHDILPFYYQKSIVSGYVHWSAETPLTKSFVSQIGEDRFGCAIDEKILQPPIMYSASKEANLNNSLLNLLTENKVSTIVIHKDYRLYWNHCNNVLKNYSNLFPHITIIGESVRNKDFHYRWSSNFLNYSFYFPQDGELTVNNVHYIDTNRDGNVSFSLNSSKLDITPQQTFSTYEYGEWKKRDVFYNTTVLIKAGDTLLIHGDKYIPNQGFFTFNYSYKSSNNGNLRRYEWGRLEKKYEDVDAEVWVIK